MPVARTYNNQVWSASPTPAPAVPAPTPPTPAPAAPAPATGLGSIDWWKTRGGHQLYDIFDRIYKENPMAGIAFWNSVVGTGRGMNDLSAATIHKMFGGDMNAFSNWRNLYHYNMLDSYAGNFDLKTGKWTPGAGFNSQYVKDRVGWDVAGPWQASWNWGDYLNQLGTGLQSIPGNEEAGAESWNTYLNGATFGPQGVTYPSPYQQAVNTGLIPPVNPAVPTPPGGTPTATPRGTPNPYTLAQQRGTTPAPAITAPAPTTPAAPSTPVSPSIPTPTNPNGAPRTYSYRSPTNRTVR